MNVITTLPLIIIIALMALDPKLWIQTTEPHNTSKQHHNLGRNAYYLIPPPQVSCSNWPQIHLNLSLLHIKITNMNCI